MGGVLVYGFVEDMARGECDGISNGFADTSACNCSGLIVRCHAAV